MEDQITMKGSTAQEVEHLPSKVREALEFKPQYHKKKKKIQNDEIIGEFLLIFILLIS
jgi:hypothetical protein